jgi:hypothetical protein
VYWKEQILGIGKVDQQYQSEKIASYGLVKERNDPEWLISKGWEAIRKVAKNK